jgi:ArsR family transcriptional regulator
MAETFRALGDPTRVRILHALSGRELCVCDLAALLDMTSSAVSHQLRLLRHLRLVRPRKAGRMVYYSLDDDHVVDLFQRCLEHVTHAGQATGTAAAGLGRPAEGKQGEGSP